MAEREMERLLRMVPLFRDRPVQVVPLDGGITNRNFRVDVDGQSYVLRIGGENTALLGIDRSCEEACARAAAGVDVGPEVVAFLPEEACLVTRFVSGRGLTPEDARDDGVLGRVADALRRYHALPDGAGRFSPFDTVRAYYALAVERHVPFPPAMLSALRLLDEIEEVLQGGGPLCPCHNDLLPANLIDDGRRVRIIDWEYGGMGDRFFDLGNFAVNHALDDDGERRLLGSYFGTATPDALRRLKLMRLASDMRESLWGFLQSGISTLDFDFLDYGRSHLERFLAGCESLEPADRCSGVAL